MLILSVSIIYFYNKQLSNQSTPSIEFNRRIIHAAIVLEKVDIARNKVEYIEINESYLEQYPLLDDLFDAWVNPDNYKNATKYGNNTLIFDTTDKEAGNLLHFIQEKLYEKYSCYVDSPYYIEYNQELFSFQVGME
jgi:hypothetical protein